MDGIKLLLFGNAVVVSGGFLGVLEALDYLFETGFVWAMALGLAVCLGGLLADGAD